MSDYTQGPWKAEDGIGGDVIITAQDGAHVGVVYTWDHEPGDGSEVWGNVALVTAAPDLLAACEAAMRGLEAARTEVGWDTSTEILEDWEQAIALAKAAIAKAKGAQA